MKKFAILLIIASISVASFGQKKGLGVGVIVGEPTGLSVKVWTGKAMAFDAAAAWSLLGTQYIHLHADALLHSDVFKVKRGSLPLYYGLGARVLLADTPAIGVRVPIGVAYQFEGGPFDLFFEIAPILDLLPSSNFSFNGALGFRYYL